MSRPVTDDPNLERPGVRWTQEEESYLCWAYSQGLSLERAAKHLGGSVDATKAKACRLGLPTHPRFQARQLVPRKDHLATRLVALQGLSLEAPLPRRPDEDTVREDIPLNLPPRFYEESAVWRQRLLRGFPASVSAPR